MTESIDQLKVQQNLSLDIQTSYNQDSSIQGQGNEAQAPQMLEQMSAAIKQFRKDTPKQQAVHRTTPDLIDNSQVTKEFETSKSSVFQRLIADSSRRKLGVSQNGGQPKQKEKADNSLTKVTKSNTVSAPKFSQKLITKHEKEQQRLEQLRKEKINEEENQCRSTPHINPNSQIIARGIKVNNNQQTSIQQSKGSKSVQQNANVRLQNSKKSLAQQKQARVKQNRQTEDQQYLSYSFDQWQNPNKTKTQNSTLDQQKKQAQQLKGQNIAASKNTVASSSQSQEIVLQILRNLKSEKKQSQNAQFNNTTEILDLDFQKENNQINAQDKDEQQDEYKVNIQVKRQANANNDQSKQLQDQKRQLRAQTVQELKQKFSHLSYLPQESDDQLNRQKTQD